MGPYQVNMNRPGTTWFIPLTDAGYLNSALINFMDCWHMYFIDEWNGGRPAGTEKWIGEGKLEMRTTIAAEEQLIFVKKRLSAHAYPREVEFVAELPKTPSGKVQRYVLRQREVDAAQRASAG